MPIGLPIILFLILQLLIVLSALFSGIETALFSFGPPQLRHLQKREPTLANALTRLMKNPRRLISVILLADALVNLPLMAICLYLMREFSETARLFWIEVAGIFALLVLVCDLLPKMFALARPVRVARIGVKVVSALMPLFDPVSRWLQWISEQFADWLTPSKMQPRHFLNEAELETLAQLSAEQGVLQPEECEMIRGIIKLGDKTVRDCMTPRLDMFAIPDDLANREAIAQLREKRYRRVPVYGDSPDDILGVLDVKRLLFHPATAYTETLLPSAFVPETMLASDLLLNFLRRQQSLAIIVDEFGGTEGIITLSDIMDEILEDAIPAGESAISIEKLDANHFIASGRARLEDVSEMLGALLEFDGIDTVGGLVFNRTGESQPNTATVVGGFRFTVRRTARKRIEEVGIERLPLDEKEAQ